MFASFADKLDAPPKGIDAILQDTHPAIAHFSAEQRNEIRRQLGSASVRQIGRMMMGSDPAPIVVYNAAANVYVVMLEQPIAPNPAAPDSSTSDADKQLAELTDELTQLTLKNVQLR